MRTTRRWLLLLSTLAFCAVEAFAQGSEIPREYRGSEARIARGILDGNLIETNFRNHGELSRWNDIPWGVWPRGIGGRHVDGVGMIVAGQVPGEREKWSQFYGGRPDTILNPVILTYRDAGKRLGPSGNLWGWLPLPGFHNENRIDPVTGSRTPIPALSDDPTSWPAFWPDRLGNDADPGWPGLWNGFFGRGVRNADLESFYVVDDHSDMEYAIDQEENRPLSEYGVFYPDPSDSTMGGLGMQAQVRIFQWANVLAEDVMFIIYRITNNGAHPYRTPSPGLNNDGLYFAQIMDYGLGEEEGDETAAFDPQQDITYGWDQDGIGQYATGGTYALGYTGFAFLESPSRAEDGLDNDEDGVTDEQRFGGAGTLIVGQEAIAASAALNYDMVEFEAYNGPIESRPAYHAGRWWTGDENMDWVGYTDENGNGVWDQGEPVNNDVGVDGLGPFDLNYPGRDKGEVDGVPTAGEPNFDELDVDESDQIGLTGFDLNTRPFYENGDNLREDSWLWDRILNFAEPNIVLGQKPEAVVADVEPFLLFTSGPVGLLPDETKFFSTAWLFGDDERDFFKNRQTVQNIYNADYNFAQPPFLPKLTAVAGDGRVVLSWDTTAVASFDRFSQSFDFEGFRLYKGTDPLLSDARVISDIAGTPTFYKPIAQWDLDNGIRGPITVFGGEAVYNLGDDTGLSYFYIDEDVTNGITYYYALVAYDRGYSDPNNPGSPPIDPQENTFNVSVNQAGQVTGVSRNAAVVVPRSRTAGYVEGGANEDLSQVTEGVGTGSISVRILTESELKTDHVYQVRFYDSRQPDSEEILYETTEYDVVDKTSGEALIRRTQYVEETPLVDGFIIEVANDEEIDIIPERTGYVANRGTANELFNLDPRELDGYQTDWVASVREDTTVSYALSPFDYELRWVSPNDSSYTPPRLFGFLRTAIPVFGVNATTGEQTELLIVDRNETGEFDPGDDLVISERPGGGPRRFRYRIRFDVPGGGAGTAPSPGSVLRISVTRPFATGDLFQFTVRPATIDVDQARSELERIAVVPNPYVGTSAFEPRSQIEGRGERRIQFIHLPAQCTIKIFNLRGELVRTLEHDGGVSDGATWWDLKTADNQDVAYGVFIYHVEAPGIGEHVGKFALIK